MIGADTILLIRFLVKDFDEQAEKVKALLDGGKKIYINAIVLFELWWVLSSVYGYTKNEFVMVLDLLLETDGFVFFDNDVVRSALADYIHSTESFADCLIHSLNKNRGFETFTFNDVKGLEMMKLLK